MRKSGVLLNQGKSVIAESLDEALQDLGHVPQTGKAKLAEYGVELSKLRSFRSGQAGMGKVKKQRKKVQANRNRKVTAR